jgi:hypothetical protein
VGYRKADRAALAAINILASSDHAPIFRAPHAREASAKRAKPCPSEHKISILLRASPAQKLRPEQRTSPTLASNHFKSQRHEPNGDHPDKAWSIARRVNARQGSLATGTRLTHGARRGPEYYEVLPSVSRRVMTVLSHCALLGAKDYFDSQDSIRRISVGSRIRN